MKLVKTLALSLAVAQLAGCGNAKKADLIEALGDSEDSLSLSDSMDEVSGTIASLDENSSASSGLNLVGMASARRQVHSRACVEEDGKAVVTVSREMGRVHLFPGGLKRKGHVAGRRVEETLKRVFSLEGGEVKCKNEYVAAPDFLSPKGLKIDVEFSSEIFAGGAQNPDNVVKALGTAKGERHIAFLDEAPVTDAQVENAMQISSKAERTFIGNKKDGQEIKGTQSVATADDAPLMVRIVRNKSDFSIIERTIESGKILVSRANGIKLELSYDHVAYVREDKCARPQSGTITGSRTSADGTLSSFKVEFSAESAKLTKADGTVEEYGNACDVAEAAADGQ